PTGITGDFGKPLFFDPGESAVDAAVAQNEQITGRPGIEWPGGQTWYRQGKDTPSPAPEPGTEPSDGSPDDGKPGFTRAPLELPWEREWHRVEHRKPTSPEGEARADNPTQVSNPDGGVSRLYPDHCEVVSDKDGRVTSLTRPDGRKTTFEYDDKKQLEKVTFGDGYTYKKENGAWEMYDDKGNDIGT